jgi:dienelactone hydrolase
MKSHLCFAQIALSLAIAMTLGPQSASAWQDAPDVLPQTEKLTMEGDIAAQMVDGVDRFLLKRLAASTATREGRWNRDFSSPEAYAKSLEPNRKRLAEILGVRDARVPFVTPTLVATLDHDALIATHDRYDVFEIGWPVVRDVTSEGLLLVPKDQPFKGTVIYIPDADQTPKEVCDKEMPGQANSPARYAEAGYRVIVPRLISRQFAQRNGRAKITHREFLYRSAFELGRQLIGYEIQKVLACVDWLKAQPQGDGEAAAQNVRVEGYGEGGLIAMFAGAIDTRIDSVGVFGAFGSRLNGWQEPIDRNIFGLLNEFGDAELATMIAPRPMSVDLSAYPQVNLSGEGGGAPAVLDKSLVDPKEIDRARAITALLKLDKPWLSVLDRDETETKGQAGSKGPFSPPQWLRDQNADEQEARLSHAIERDTQWLLVESPYVRATFMQQLDTASIEKYEASVERYRKIFRDEVIGNFDLPLGEFKPRSRKVLDLPQVTGYELVLDVWDDVFAYGILLLPKDLKPGEKRPVVVCQHGLEGRPTDVIQGDHPAYHDFATKLCERGFVVFAPQNLYIGKDRFRTLQRKANPLGKTLFSIIVPQHQQIVNWLKSQDYVDAKRIGFYGLSYGGKSAMRIPPLVTDYALSICSADFNEWVAKNASTRLPFSYVWTGEYEIFEWDLGSRFNYAEMAALIAPRPFMVERGHTDGVSTDEWVAFEYAKVFNLYSHRLKVPDRCEMEVFDGPHTINGKGTFDFLHKHLQWPKR